MVHKDSATLPTLMLLAVDCRGLAARREASVTEANDVFVVQALLREPPVAGPGV